MTGVQKCRTVGPSVIKSGMMPQIGSDHRINTGTYGVAEVAVTGTAEHRHSTDHLIGISSDLEPHRCARQTSGQRSREFS